MCKVALSGNKSICSLLIFSLWGINFCIASSIGIDTIKSNISGYIENKGQVLNQKYQPNKDVLFMLYIPGRNIQLRKNGFSYDLYKVISPNISVPSRHSNSLTPPIDSSEFVIDYHRIDFEFVDANPAYTIVTTGAFGDFLNYYNSNTTIAGVTNVRQYSSIIYKNIYPGIDIVFTYDSNGYFKYNFIIHNDGNIENIKIKISQPENVTFSSDSIQISTSIGNIEEHIPFSYYISKKGQVEAKIKFHKISQNIFGFYAMHSFLIYDTLVIDPTSTQNWGTYYGGSNVDRGLHLAVDSLHNVFMCGYTFSINNIATNGAYQSTKIGTKSGFLVKFNASGVREWGTYYSGDINGIVELDACVADIKGNIYVAGFTSADSGITTPGAHQHDYGGGNQDAMLAKFNTNGLRLWATYYGGENDDEVWHGLNTDETGNVCISGGTGSSTNISTTGSYQEIKDDFADGFLAKFDSTGIRIWATYFGGNDEDEFRSCSIDALGNIYCCGTTSSTSGIASPGAHQTVYGGNPRDAMLVAFNSSGQKLWSTYYGGGQEDQAFFCLTDSSGFIYLTGYTSSSSGIASAGGFQEFLAGGNDGYIVKFDQLGQRIWGTYYGGELNENLLSCALGENGDVFYLGWTQSQNNISTSNAYMTNYAGGFADAFLVKISATGTRIWGTYFGGPLNDQGWSCVYVPNDTIYFCGFTQSTSNISTINGHQISPGGYDDGFLEKFIECWPIDAAGPITGPDIVCKPASGVSYSVPPLAHAATYYWTFPPGLTLSNGYGPNAITAGFGPSSVSGNITVAGVNKCGDFGTTASIYVTVNSRPLPTLTGIVSLCQGETITYTTEPGKTGYIWGYSAGGISSGGGTVFDNFITITWTTPGTQWLSVNYSESNGCMAESATQLNVEVSAGLPVSVAIAASQTQVCVGTSVTFTATPTNPGNAPIYQWKVNGTNQGINSPVFSYVPLNNDLVICILTSSNTTCISNNPATSNQVEMVVNPNIAVGVSIGAIPNPYCTGDQVTITATPDHGGLTPTYLWKVNDIAMTAIGPVYTYTPVNGDQVRCYLTSSLQCTTNNPAMSNNIVLTENSNFPAGVSVTATANPFCPGTSVTYTAWPTNGGPSPSYQWLKNGVNTGANLPTYTYTPQPGDSIRCIMTSNLSCVTGSPASSAKVIMSALPVPAVTFTTCFDTITTLSAKPIKLHGGLPYGGTYSGPGVNSSTGIFTPSVAGTGTKTITYSYVNVALCSAGKNKTVTVQANPAFTCGNNLVDIRDNKSYPTVQIGTQCWMQTNLDYGWQIADNVHQTDNCIVEKYISHASPVTRHAFYQWDEVMRYDPTPGLQGLCPPGWHVPDETEWNTLFNFYQGNARAGYPLQDPYLNGFKARQNGVYYLNSMWSFTDFATLFWSSTMADQTRAYAHGMNTIDQSVSVYAGLKANGFSVRCLRD